MSMVIRFVMDHINLLRVGFSIGKCTAFAVVRVGILFWLSKVCFQLELS